MQEVLDRLIRFYCDRERERYIQYEREGEREEEREIYIQCERGRERGKENKAFVNENPPKRMFKKNRAKLAFDVVKH